MDVRETIHTSPNENVVRNSANVHLFEAFVTNIRSRGDEGRFYRRAISYYEEDGPMYWTMGAR